MSAVLKTNWQLFERLFKFLCFIITFGLISFWSYKFILNEDLSIVEYKEFNDKEDGSPYLSQALCFRRPFLSLDRIQMNESRSEILSIAFETKT